MTDQLAPSATTTPNTPRILQAGLAAFAATTGALLTFGRGRSGAWYAFEQVGRNVARDVFLPQWGSAILGVVVHLGQSLALGACVILLLRSLHSASRLRAALLVAIAWQCAAWLPWLAVIRVDQQIPLSGFARVGLAVLLITSLMVGAKRARE